MRTRTQNRVIGTTGEAGFHRGQQERAQEELQFFDSTTVWWEQTTRGIRAHAKPSFGGDVSDFPWQTPYKELDPSVAVEKYTFVCISPQNPIATVGLIDLVLPGSQTLLATPGIWQALCDVPPVKDGIYNMPQDPVPTSGVAVPSGSPLKGDLDGTEDPYKVYWLLWKSTC